MKKLLVVVAVATLFSAMAFAAKDRSPAIHFALKLHRPQFTFPDEYKEKYPAIYEAYRQLSKIPETEAQLKRTFQARIEKIRKGKGSDYKKSKKIRKLKRQLDKKLEELAKKRAELRNAFLFLAEDFLSENDDPYVLFFAAREFYEIRGEPPIVRKPKKKKGKAVKLDEFELEDNTNKDSKKQAKKEKKRKEYKNNYERIEDYCRRIIENFSDFEHMDDVLFLYGAVLQERGKHKEAIKAFDRIVNEFSKSYLYKDALFRKAEIMFATPIQFDHYDQAYELYKQLLDKCQKGSKLYFRALYKLAWSAYLSMNYSEDTEPLFLRLYQELKAMDEEQLDKEQKSMMAEAKHLLLQFRRGRPGTYEFFK